MTADRYLADLDGRLDLASVARELQRYAAGVSSGVAPGFNDAVMRAVVAEPMPRRGLLAILADALTLRGPMQRTAQAAALLAVLMVAVGGGLAAGQLAELLRSLQGGGPGVPGVLSPGAEPSGSQGWRSPAVDEPVDGSSSPSPRPRRSAAPTHQQGDELMNPPATPTPSAGAVAPSAEASGTPDASDSPEPSASSSPNDSGNSGPGGGGSGSGSGSGSSGSGSGEE